MKISKKLLVIGMSILLTLGISIILAWPMAILLPAVSLSVYTMAYFVGIILGYSALQYIRETLVIKKELELYNNKPYKSYAIETACQYCGDKATHSVDLDNLEYKCGKCKRINAIYVTFMTAAVTSPESINIP